MPEATEDLREEITQLRSEVVSLRQELHEQDRLPDDHQHNKTDATRRGVRMRSKKVFMGLPLYDVAMGPDPATGEAKGYARGIFAVGDVATGVVALGGFARGVFAFGGLAVGAFAFGGASVGLVLAMGGAAIGGIAMGGAACGIVAAGPAAATMYPFSSLPGQ